MSLHVDDHIRTRSRSREGRYRDGYDHDDYRYGPSPPPPSPGHGRAASWSSQPRGGGHGSEGYSYGYEKSSSTSTSSYALSEKMLNFLPQKYGRKYGGKERDDGDLAYGTMPPPPTRSSTSASGRYYEDGGGGGGGGSRRDSYHRPSHVLTVENTRERERSVERRRHDGSPTLAVDPGRSRGRDRWPGPATLGVDRSRDRSGQRREVSPRPPTTRMSSLTVDHGRSSHSLSAAPASPLLESYRGTYQDCSPMPSPLLLPTKHHHHLEALSPLNSDMSDDDDDDDDNNNKNKRGRRARFHDGQDIASTMAQALRGQGRPDTQPLIDILPSLTHEQVMELRSDYKRLVKTGSEGKGVNVAKHIRVRLKDDDDAYLAKACYAVALGRWESEAYWANFWYQGDKNRHELLIEALMGRSNDEIRRIKDAFTDKKYAHSLTTCLGTELKEDKFKKAVLLVLDECRMEDEDGYGRPRPLDSRLVHDDVLLLRRALKADKGGETAMMEIVVRRSHHHLRAVLQEYERTHHANFAREALKRSGNLVGELLAHILNGVINRPVRDALLLHHALNASRKDDLRRELLISRLVRFHWDPAHMQAVRRSFRDRYAKDLRDAVRDSVPGPLGRFCAGLCIARVPNDVRRVERLQHHGHH